MIVLILLVAALVCFLLAGFGVPTRVGIGWVGAALITITLIIAAWPAAHA